MFSFDKVLGVLEEKEEAIPEEIMELVKQREEARKNKDFAKSDELRDQIKKKGYVVEDKKEGVRVKRI